MFLFNSSRSSLYHVLICNYEKFKNKKILIPAYTCHTVVDTIIRAKISYEYYNIGLDLSILIFSKLNLNSYQIIFLLF